MNKKTKSVLRNAEWYKKHDFITEFWSNVFDILKWISPFQIILALIPVTKKRSYWYYFFVDKWVLGNLLLSIVLLSICSAPNLIWWEIIAISYGGLRVFEVFIYQINALLFDEYRARKKKAEKTYARGFVRSFLRLMILLLHNYAEIIFWFALFYRNLGWAFETGTITINSFFVSLNLSFVTMSTFGHTAIFSRETLGDIVIFTQSVIGLFMALLILAKFISSISTPETLDKFEK